eukprot:g25945.t1
MLGHQETVELNLFVPEDAKARDVKVEVSESNLRITHNGATLLAGEWEFKVEPEEDVDWELKRCHDRRALRLLVRKAPMPGGMSVSVWWSGLLKGEPQIDVKNIEARQRDRDKSAEFKKAWTEAHVPWAQLGMGALKELPPPPSLCASDRMPPRADAGVSFAESLARKVDAFHVQQREEKRQWVAKEIEKFKQLCEHAASSKGKYGARWETFPFTVKEADKSFYESEFHRQMGRLGFASFGVARRSKRGERMSVKLEATWKARKEPAEPQAEPQAEPPSKRKRLKAHEGAHGHAMFKEAVKNRTPIPIDLSAQGPSGRRTRCLSAELVEAQLSVTQCSSVLDLTDQELLEQVKGCEAVVSCLSHVGNPWAKPHDLCLSISKRICSAMQQAAQAETTGTRPKYLMMGTVLVPKADGSEKAHGWASTFMVGLLNTLLPPMYDHKLTAAYLNENMSSENPLVDHVVIRPNLLVDKPVSEYQTFDELQTGVFSPQDCSRANVAQFMRKVQQWVITGLSERAPVQGGYQKHGPPGGEALNKREKNELQKLRAQARREGRNPDLVMLPPPKLRRAPKLREPDAILLGPALPTMALPPAEIMDAAQLGRACNAVARGDGAVTLLPGLAHRARELVLELAPRDLTKVLKAFSRQRYEDADLGALLLRQALTRLAYFDAQDLVVLLSSLVRTELKEELMPVAEDPHRADRAPGALSGAAGRHSAEQCLQCSRCGACGRPAQGTGRGATTPIAGPTCVCEKGRRPGTPEDPAVENEVPVVTKTEYLLVNLNEETGEVSLLQDNGELKDDVKVEADIMKAFSSDRFVVTVVVMAACGEEKIASDGEVLGVALYNRNSSIALRILSRTAYVRVDAGFFAQRLSAALQIIHSGSADEVWLIPCGPRPDKPHLQTTPLDRYCMCQIAVNSSFSPSFPVQVSDLETFRETAFYTYDLLQSLREQYPEIDFAFVIGSDWLQAKSNITQWRSKNPHWKPGMPEEQKLIVTGDLA